MLIRPENMGAVTRYLREKSRTEHRKMGTWNRTHPRNMKVKALREHDITGRGNTRNKRT